MDFVLNTKLIHNLVFIKPNYVNLWKIEDNLDQFSPNPNSLPASLGGFSFEPPLSASLLSLQETVIC